MDTCSKVTVLDHGEKIAEGTPSQIKDDNAVIEAYLGKKMDIKPSNYLADTGFKLSKKT